jgi:CRISPR/Cas system CMR-associated protein Cmr3 (group 5 of RAMP superfamily)
MSTQYSNVQVGQNTQASDVDLKVRKHLDESDRLFNFAQNNWAQLLSCETNDARLEMLQAVSVGMFVSAIEMRRAEHLTTDPEMQKKYHDRVSYIKVHASTAMHFLWNTPGYSEYLEKRGICSLRFNRWNS